MKRAEVNGRPVRHIGHQREVVFEKENEGEIGDNKGYETARTRMLENLKLALFFCRAQGRMARGEQ